MKLTVEVHELSEGISAVLYDEHGQAIDTHLTESQAQTIAHRVNVHDELVAALKLIDNAAKDSKSIIGFSAIVFKSIPQIRAALERAKQ